MTPAVLRRRTAPPAILFLAALAACVAPPAWQPFTAADIGFTVSMPGRPEIKDLGADEDGMITHTYSAGDKDRGGEYGVLVWDYPESIDLRSMSEGEVLKLLKEAFLAGFKGEELANGYSQLAGRRAREIEIDSETAGRVHVRVLVLDQRIFAVMTANAKPDDHTAKRGEFFDSFKLIEAPAATAEAAPEDPAAPAAPAEATSAAPAASAEATPAPPSEGEAAPAPASLTKPDREKYESYAIRTKDGQEFTVPWFEIVQGKVLISMGGGEFGIAEGDVVIIEGRARDDRIVQGRRSSPSGEAAPAPRDARRTSRRSAP